MPQTVTLPFPVIKLRLATGEEVAMPLADTNAFHLGCSAEDLAAKYAARFQQKLLDKGNFSSLLDILRQGEFIADKLVAGFPAAKDGITYPAFELEFDYFIQKTVHGLWGILPALGVEALGADEEELRERLLEVVRVEFTSKQRLQSVYHIFSAHWYGQAEIKVVEVNLKTYSPSELVDLQKEKKQELLPKVAEKLVVGRQAAYGREEELGYMERILKSRFSRNILVVGPSGTGKTALVWELARRRKSPGSDVTIWETTASVLIKELATDSGWQNNLSILVKELTRKGDILYIRNLAEMFEVGRYEGNPVSMGEYLRPFLSRGEISLISECTPEERARIEAKNPNYLSFFQTILLREPAGQVLENIISQKTLALAGQRRISVEPDAIREIIRLHKRFSPYSGMPGKPIRFLESILPGVFHRVGAAKKKKKKKDPAPESDEVPRHLTRSMVLRHFCEESGMPPFMVDPDLTMDTRAIRQRFNSNVFGQKRAVNATVDMLAAVKTALTRVGKPIASFLFAGPTGVGKTELAKVLAEFMFGSRDRLLRFDMSEYSDPWSVMRLTGEGYFSDGLLTSAVRREPFCVLLFDEIDKADQKFFELLLQILSEGRLTDSKGKLVNFCSAIIIMTSNMGASDLQIQPVAFKKDILAMDIADHFTRAVEKHFRPELFNRIDAILAFEPLSKLTVRHVVEREIELFKNREGIRFRHLDLTFSENVLDFLAESGYDARYGARYLQRTIREKLIVPLAQELNRFEFDDHLMVIIGLTDGNLKVSIESDPLGFDLLVEQWDKLTLAEQTSHERRRIMLMQESPLFMRFQSELDILEGSYTRLGNQFWQNDPQSKLYTQLLGVREKTWQLAEAVHLLETEIALASMGQGVFQTDFSDRLEQWKEDFFRLLMELYSLLFPKRNTCNLAIYGTELDGPLHFYLELFKEKKFVIKQANTVWFRENYVPEAVPEAKIEEAEPAEELGVGEPGEQPEPENGTAAYLKLLSNQKELGDGKFLSQKKNDRLYGIELQVAGPCVWLYLKEEKGLQHWETQVKNEFAAYQIVTNMQKAQTPEGIHRSAFYKNSKPRRIVRQGLISDVKLSVMESLRKDELTAFFLQKLDEQFRNAIYQAFREVDPGNDGSG